MASFSGMDRVGNNFALCALCGFNLTWEEELTSFAGNGFSEGVYCVVVMVTGCWRVVHLTAAHVHAGHYTNCMSLA